MSRRTNAIPLITIIGASAILLSGCAAPAADPSADGVVTIVASTSVYGDVAVQVAGDLASVESIVSSAAQDPHSYEASARDQLTVSRADLIIENGGGYDPFIDTLIAGSGSTAAVINASEVSGLLDESGVEDSENHDNEGDDHSGDDHEHLEGFNEHVWYSFHAIERVAERIAEELSALDGANAETYRANADSFVGQLESLEARAESIAAEASGGVVAVTEPVAVYLLSEAGLVDETPADFTEAIEEGTDVSPAALLATLDLLESGEVRLLAYNEQTTSAETERVLEAAEAAGIPIVSFSETLPDGSDYVSWMTGNLEALAAALARP